ncbi:unnamed protein product, partial [Owenia fusiformis]
IQGGNMMSTPYMMLCLVFVVMCSGHASAVWYEYWTNWINVDRPSGNGEGESRPGFAGKKLVEADCLYPNGIECQTASDEPYYKHKQTFEKGYDCTVMLGLICLNKRNTGMCKDYKTRYRCNKGGIANPCTQNNGLCTHQCNYCTNCKGRWCRCFPGYSLMRDYKTCNEPLRCFECNSIDDPTKCGQITNTDDKVLQLPCNTMCFTAKDWDGNYWRGCADTEPSHPNRCFGSDRVHNYRPPSTPGKTTWRHPWTSPSKPDVQLTFCKGDLCNGNGGSAKIIKGYGSLSSQNFGGDLKYDNNILTEYVIHSNHRMKVTFSHFSIEGHPACGYDSLTLHDGGTSSASLIGGPILPEENDDDVSGVADDIPQSNDISVNADSNDVETLGGQADIESYRFIASADILKHFESRLSKYLQVGADDDTKDAELIGEGEISEISHLAVPRLQDETTDRRRASEKQNNDAQTSKRSKSFSEYQAELFGHMNMAEN